MKIDLAPLLLYQSPVIRVWLDITKKTLMFGNSRVVHGNNVSSMRTG
jgi:hypothetical protein